MKVMPSRRRSPNERYEMMKCSFCGHEFPESEGRAGCRGCPLSITCGKLNCPNCGFEMPREPGLVKLIKRRHRNE